MPTDSFYCAGRVRGCQQSPDCAGRLRIAQTPCCLWSAERSRRLPKTETDSGPSDGIMGTMASQITSLTIVYSTVYLGTDQRKHQSSASLAFVLGIHRWPVNSPHKGPVTRKMLPFDYVIMSYRIFPQRIHRNTDSTVQHCERCIPHCHNPSTHTDHPSPLQIWKKAKQIDHLLKNDISTTCN